jgi:hypothetical protein
MIHLKKAALALAVASSITLVGCNNSGAYIPTSGESAGSETVAGAAVKGVLKSANVTVYELDNSGTRIRSFESVTTDANGEYEVALSDAYEGGLLEVEVTAVPGQTKMVCDSSACGTLGADVDLPAGFTLGALAAKSADGAKISAPVTAWSTMAAKRAKVLAESGRSISDSSRQAVAEVNQVAGFDISRTAAKAVTSLAGTSAEEQQAAVMNAAVAQLVFGATDGDFTKALESFSEALNDGEINSEDSFTAATLSSVVKSVVETTSGLDESAQESLNNQTASLDAAGDSLAPSYDPELDLGEGATQAEKIAAFQKFVTQFRSWAGSIDETAAALQDETSAVSIALDADVATVEDIFAQAGVTADLVSKVLDAFSEQLAGADGRAALLDALENGTTFNSPQTWTSEEDSSVTGTMEATLVFENTDSGLQATATGTVAQTGGESRDFDLAIGTSLTQEDLDLTYDAEQVLSLLAQNTVSVSGVIGDGTGFERAVLDLTATLELSEAITSGVTDQAVLDKFSAIGLDGSVALANPEAASFVGTVSAKAVSMSGSSFSALDEPFSPASFSLSGDFTATSGRTFNLSASLNNKNAQRFNLFTYLDYNDTTTSFDFNVDRQEVEQFVELGDGATEYYFKIVDGGGSCNGSGYDERIAFSNSYDAMGNYDSNCNVLEAAENSALDQLILDRLEAAVGSQIASESEVEWLEVHGNSFDAIASVDTDVRFPNIESADNFVNLSLNLAAGVSLVDMPKATAVVTLTRSTFTGGSVLANVSWDGGSYNLKVGTDGLNEEYPEVALAFWNPQGFRLEAVGSEDAEGTQSLTGNVFVNGEDIGDVTLRNGIPVITYPNGDETVFESLF